MDDVLCFCGMFVAAKFQLGLHDPNSHHYYRSTQHTHVTLARSHWLSRASEAAQSRVVHTNMFDIYDLSL